MGPKVSIAWEPMWCEARDVGSVAGALNVMPVGPFAAERRLALRWGKGAAVGVYRKAVILSVSPLASAPDVPLVFPEADERHSAELRPGWGWDLPSSPRAVSAWGFMAREASLRGRPLSASLLLAALPGGATLVLISVWPGRVPPGRVSFTAPLAPFPCWESFPADSFLPHGTLSGQDPKPGTELHWASDRRSNVPSLGSLLLIHSHAPAWVKLRALSTAQTASAAGAKGATLLAGTSSRLLSSNVPATEGT